MKTNNKRFVIDVLNMIEEIEELEKKIEIMEISMNKEEVEENHINMHMIDYGKKMLFNNMLEATKYDYELKFEYVDGEISTTFEKWYNQLIEMVLSRQAVNYNSQNIKIPTSIPLDATIEILRPLASIEFEKRRKEAQLIYARSMKEEQ